MYSILSRGSSYDSNTLMLEVSIFWFKSLIVFLVPVTKNASSTISPSKILTPSTTYAPLVAFFLAMYVSLVKKLYLSPVCVVGISSISY
jgi:hypothetical protein